MMKRYAAEILILIIIVAWFIALAFYFAQFLK
jgi:hypothetical protein